MYEPYKFDSFKILMRKALMHGLYGGKHDLLTVTIKGAFEGFSGRATETWEQRFFVEFRVPHDRKPVDIYEAIGETLEQACKQILDQLSKETPDGN